MGQLEGLSFEGVLRKYPSRRLWIGHSKNLDAVNNAPSPVHTDVLFDHVEKHTNSRRVDWGAPFRTTKTLRVWLNGWFNIRDIDTAPVIVNAEVPPGVEMVVGSVDGTFLVNSTIDTHSMVAVYFQKNYMTQVGGCVVNVTRPRAGITPTNVWLGREVLAGKVLVYADVGRSIAALRAMAYQPKVA